MINNRFIILLLLLALLYALYRYQLMIEEKENKKEKVKKIKNTNNNNNIKNIELKPNYDTKLIDEETAEEALDGISQYSLGSLADVKSKDDGPYRTDSLFNSLESDNTYSFMNDSNMSEEVSNDESFFFQQ